MAVAQDAAAHLADDLRDHEAGEEERRAGEVPLVALHQVGDQVHGDGADDEQGEAVPAGDEPEGAVANGLAQREVVVGARGAACGCVAGRVLVAVAVRVQSEFLRAVPEELGERKADAEREDAGEDGGLPPSERRDGQCDQRRHDRAAREADRGDGHGAGALPDEPVSQRRVDGEEACEARAYGDDREGGEEVPQLLYLSEQDEPDAEQEGAGAHERPGAEAVQQPALDGAEQAGLDAEQAERP